MAKRMSREEMWQQQEEMFDKREFVRPMVEFHYRSRGIRDAVNNYKRAIYSVPKGSRILEIGCGEGHDLVKYHEKGLEAIGIDISGQSIELSQEKLKNAGFDPGHAIHMNAEDLDFPDSSFDLICGVAILHHLSDLTQAGKAIRRLLKPGGKCMFIEPLGHNPCLNLYRRFTPAAHTPSEHPLKKADIAAFTKSFREHSLQCHLLFGLAANAALMATRSTTFYNLLDAVFYPIDNLFLKAGPQKYLAFLCKIEASV